LYQIARVVVNVSWDIKLLGLEITFEVQAVKSHALGVRLTHLRSISRSHA